MGSKILRTVIIGAPGSGKGTISKRIVKVFGFEHVSTGDILRRNIEKKTELGKIAKSYIDKGQLLPDDIITKVTLARLAELNKVSYVLDGFPRNCEQAEILKKRVKLDAVLNLCVPHDVIIERVKNRWVHLKSGRVYNVGFNSPKVAGKDDETGEPLIQRPDDKPEVVKKRLKIFDEMMTPVIEWYEGQCLIQHFSGSESNKLWISIEDFLCDKLQGD